VEAIGKVIAEQDLHGATAAFSVVGRPSRSFLSPVEGGVETLIETIARRTGVPPELSTGGGTSDARFIADYCPVVECGLPGQTMHKVDEHIHLADLEELTALYAAFLKDYLG
jgi:succinyl-diaminopimelate desuccinylase